ncbi:ABC-F family ATP-binding cassette domain-containing protein [Ahrensia sp. R2A130]|uniref:ABC-F family ATP-binding cassette domain-containing protein n=1 Tax=Ahrensia sp. R2A130 TaxID=744979 RepID=UPI0001E0942A|nr:ABC-F family ATP-binding cassette domain-containing protein [Ahrensia sp. R2A130]EFL90587.1 GCN20-type ATP-binding cassette protein GCN3 [Ahrensia sp. R2A130]
MLHIEDLTFRMQGRLLIENASIHVPMGARVGFVGRNGTGKTTLFKLITGEYGPETGSLRMRKKMRLGQVAQEAPGTEFSLLETVLEADKERAELLAEADTATDPTRIADIHTRLNDIEAHSAEARAGAILHGLGFDAEAQARPCSAFSGGWRMRVALAAVLFSEPDLLLLDEPTNYLDLEGTLWLENYISRYPHTVIIISHDRDLLNTCCNTIIHLENRKLTSYKGDYDFFEKTRAERNALQTKMKVKQDAKRAHMESFINRFKAKASKATQAQSRVKALEKMAVISAVQTEDVAPLHFPSPERRPASPIINMEGAQVGYTPGQPVIENMTLRIDADDRIALLGANGNGKSTFAKLIAGRLDATGGLVRRSEKLKIAMFAQHNMDDLVPEETPVDHIRKLVPNEPDGKLRGRVARMGLGAEKMDTKAKSLSGGEKARLLLGLATFHQPHLLILDEPTNHLDIDSRESLVMALNDYRGAVILISHDRHLVEASADRLWLVHDGTVGPYDGDLEDYRRLILKGPGSPKSKPAEKEAQGKSKAKPSAADVDAAERRRREAKLRSNQSGSRARVKQLEATMGKAAEAIKKLDKLLAQASTERDAKRIRDIAMKKAEFERRLVGVEEEWLELSEALAG